jgi:prolyl oligopeptidase
MNRLIPIAICNCGSYGNSTGPFFSPITLVYTIDDDLLVVPHVKSEIEAT